MYGIYEVTTLPDDGKPFTIRLNASSEAAARVIVCDVEKCPDRAIARVVFIEAIDLSANQAGVRS